MKFNSIFFFSFVLYFVILYVYVYLGKWYDSNIYLIPILVYVMEISNTIIRSIRLVKHYLVFWGGKRGKTTTVLYVSIYKSVTTYCLPTLSYFDLFYLFFSLSLSFLLLFAFLLLRIIFQPMMLYTKKNLKTK